MRKHRAYFHEVYGEKGMTEVQTSSKWISSSNLDCAKLKCIQDWTMAQLHRKQVGLIKRWQLSRVLKGEEAVASKRERAKNNALFQTSWHVGFEVFLISNIFWGRGDNCMCHSWWCSGTINGAGDWNGFSHMQGKHLNPCTISPGCVL